MTDNTDIKKRQNRLIIFRNFILVLSVLIIINLFRLPAFTSFLFDNISIFLTIFIASLSIVFSLFLIRLYYTPAKYKGSTEMFSGKDVHLIKESICYNQGKLAEYAFLAGEKHKKIKDILRNKEESIDTKVLDDACNDLDSFLNTELMNIYKENFKFLLRYFESRSMFHPRVCVKAFNNDMISPLFRDRTLLPNKEYPVNANTAFQYIYETGQYYLCNDIPKATKSGTYKNARIDMKQAMQYKKPSLVRQVGGKYVKIIDHNWINCWIMPEEKKNCIISLPPEACYKSTLVIPMTLINNSLHPAFKQHFHIDIVSPKTIYGFICIDSHESNFFNNNEDISLGYIFADIMSLYIINQLTYTTYSASYLDAMKYLKENR